MSSRRRSQSFSQPPTSVARHSLSVPHNHLHVDGDGDGDGDGDAAARVGVGVGVGVGVSGDKGRIVGGKKSVATDRVISKRTSYFHASASPTGTSAFGIRRPRMTLVGLLRRELSTHHRASQATTAAVPTTAAMTATKSVEVLLNMYMVPMRFEQLVAYGFLSCVDSLLYLPTIFPLVLVSRVLCMSRQVLHDACLVGLTSLSFALLGYLDFSHSYHLVRGESMLKLYVLYNALELFGRLLAAWGHDCLDALDASIGDNDNDNDNDNGNSGGGGSTAEQRLVALTSCVIYVILHTSVVFFQVVTLNVSINSSNYALLTLLISSNFAEIKGSVFKKFDEKFVFQLACADVAERVELLVFCITIGMLQAQVSGSWVVAVLFSEILVDWIKHAFVTRFNRKPATLFTTGLYTLCRDTLAAPSFLHSSAWTEKRVGIVRLPLFALLLRVAWDVSYDISFIEFSSVYTHAAFIALVWCVLCSLKIFVSVLMYAIAAFTSAKLKAQCDAQYSDFCGCYRYVMVEKRIP
eukprot:ANDGO_01646.mRNA.1 Protein TAPT1 homolog